MPARPEIVIDSTESLESVIARSPKENLRTPPSKKTVPLRPLKRVCFAGSIQTDEDDKENVPPSDDENNDARLSPRKLDLDQAVTKKESNDVVPDSEDEEDGQVRPTQENVVGTQEERDEGEIADFTRAASSAL